MGTQAVSSRSPFASSSLNLSGWKGFGRRLIGKSGDRRLLLGAQSDVVLAFRFQRFDSKPRMLSTRPRTDAGSGRTKPRCRRPNCRAQKGSPRCPRHYIVVAVRHPPPDPRQPQQSEERTETRPEVGQGDVVTQKRNEIVIPPVAVKSKAAFTLSVGSTKKRGLSFFIRYDSAMAKKWAQNSGCDLRSWNLVAVPFQAEILI